MDRFHIESLDILKAKEQLELRYISENTRKDDVYTQLLDIIKKLEEVPVFPSLMWIWALDVLKEIFENNQYRHLADYDEEAVPVGITLKQIFNKFWDDVDDLGLSMDSGGEIIEETIRDWMRDNDFLVPLEEKDND